MARILEVRIITAQTEDILIPEVVPLEADSMHSQRTDTITEEGDSVGEAEVMITITITTTEAVVDPSKEDLGEPVVFNLEAEDTCLKQGQVIRNIKVFHNTGIFAACAVIGVITTTSAILYSISTCNTNTTSTRLYRHK